MIRNDLGCEADVTFKKQGKRWVVCDGNDILGVVVSGGLKRWPWYVINFNYPFNIPSGGFQFRTRNNAAVWLFANRPFPETEFDGLSSIKGR